MINNTAEQKLGTQQGELSFFHNVLLRWLQQSLVVLPLYSVNAAVAVTIAAVSMVTIMVTMAVPV